MLQAIILKLKSLWQNVRQEFLSAPVKSSLAAVGLCTILFQTTISLIPKDYSSNRVIKFLSITTENNLLLIILSMGLLVLSFTMLRNKTNADDILHKNFGVYWDSVLDIYCLSCKKPLKNSSFGPSIFFCSDPKCNSKHILKDHDGNELTYQQAFDLMAKL